MSSGRKAKIRKVCAEHKKYFGFVHTVIPGRHSQQSGHSDFIRIFILYFHFSFESIYHRSIQLLGKRDHFLVCSPTADAAEKSNAFMMVQQLRQLYQVFFRRTDFRRSRIILYRRIDGN